MLQTNLITHLSNPGRAAGMLSLVPGLLAAALLFTAPVIVSESSSAFAQEEEKNDKAPMEGRKTQALGKRVYEAITEANEKVDAEDYAGARAVLDKVKAMPNLTPYETAQLYSFYGFLYYNSERYPQAITAYETVLRQPELPEGLQQQTLKTLSQLMFVTEEYRKAINYAQQYMDAAGEDPDMYAVIGTAYYQLEEKDKIIPAVERAISLARERGTSVKEQWWLLLRVAYWEKENYRKVREILETLIVGWPKKDYWVQLSGICFELKDEGCQLAAYEAAFDQGMLQSSSELVQMGQLFMQGEVPFKAAKVLEQGLEEGKIERTERNLRLLSQAWQMSQEDRKAIAPLNEAAGMSGDGELYARLATSYLNLSEYKNCIDASQKALDRGGLKDTGNAWLVKGMCQFENKALNSARSSFQNCVRFEKCAKYGRSWITYVDSEQERLRQLQQSLQRVRAGDSPQANQSAQQPQDTQGS